MPRTPDPKSSAAGGMGQGWTVVIDLLAAIGVWAGIGYGLDRWFHTGPILLAVGMVLGATGGIYTIYRRSIESVGKQKAGTLRPGAGVSRNRHEVRPAIGDGGVSSREPDERGNS